MADGKILIFNDKLVGEAKKRRLERKGHKVDCVSDAKEAVSLFDKNEYDHVLIGFSVPGGDDVLKHIVERKPSQRIITISTVDSCSDPEGCENCVEKYNKRRLMLPDDLNKLDYTLENFDNIECEYASKLEPSLFNRENREPFL